MIKIITKMTGQRLILEPTPITDKSRVYSIDSYYQEFKLDQITELENNIDDKFKKIDMDNEKNLEKLMEISNGLASGLDGIKDIKNDTHKNIELIGQLIELSKCSVKTMETVYKDIQYQTEINKMFDHRIDAINERIEEIKDYINLPWYKKLFQKCI